MLEGEDGGGREDGDLLAVLYGLEGGAHGDLGLAVADIAAEQAVHGLRRFHVALDVGDGGGLVVGLVEVEGVLELALHVAVGREGGADGGLALGVELEQLGGHIGHRLFDARLGLLPRLRAKPVALGRRAGLAAAIFLDEVEAGERDVELGLVGELEDHQLQRRLAGLFNDAQAAVLRDAVLNVDDVVADGEVAEVGDEGGGFGLAADNGAGLNVGVVDEIVCAEQDDLACGGAAIGVAQVEDLHSIRNRRLHDDGRLQVAAR